MPTLISGSTGVNKIQDGTIVNADINSSAAIAGTKLVMPTGSVLQAQITGYTSSSPIVVSNTGSATLMTITITVRANSKVMMWFDSHQTALSGTNVNPNVTFAMDGSDISPDTNHYFYQSGGRTVIHKIFLTGALSAGSHTFTVVGEAYNGSVTYNYQSNNGGRFMLQEIAG